MGWGTGVAGWETRTKTGTRTKTNKQTATTTTNNNKNKPSNNNEKQQKWGMVSVDASIWHTTEQVKFQTYICKTLSRSYIPSRIQILGGAEFEKALKPVCFFVCFSSILS